MSNCISAMFRKGKVYALLLICTLLASLFAVSGAVAAEAKVRVLATTYPVYLITRAVTQSSPDVQVDLLIPAQTGCPHDYALTPQDMRKLAAADGSVRRPKSKEIVRGIARGAVFRQRAGGGGGYGDPRERPAELVAADVLDGVLSIAAARDDYGVVIDAKTLQLDQAATRLRREAP